MVDPDPVYLRSVIGSETQRQGENQQVKVGFGGKGVIHVIAYLIIYSEGQKSSTFFLK